MIDEEMKKVKFSEKDSKKSKESKEVPFVVNYHSSLNCISLIIKDNLKILYMNRETKAVFSWGNLASFRSAHENSSCLVELNYIPLKDF